MEFTLNFNMDNAAFDTAPEQEVKRILLVAAERVEQGVTRSLIRDVNGNNIGRWDIIGD